MESVDQDIENNEPTVQKVGAGQLLAEARKKQDKSLEDIAQVLNLSVTQLRAIEMDKSEGLPEPTYVRGYIRGYATLLGLDVEDVVSHYQGSHWDQSANLDRLPRGVTQASQERQYNFAKPLKLLIFSIILAFLVYVFTSGKVTEWLSNNGTVQQFNAPEQQTATGSEETDLASTEESTEESSDESADLVPEELPGTEDDSASENIEAANDSQENAEQSQSANNIEIKFLDTSWIDIRDTNDDRLAYKSFAKGETLSLSSDLPLNVFIGNASGVVVTYNNEPFDISDYQQGVYAKFRLGQN